MPMANEPRNEFGQTKSEWIQSQQMSQQDSIFGTNLEPWDLLVGMDRAKGIPGVRFSDMGIIVGRVVRPISPSVQGYSQQASGQYGTTFQGVSYGSKTFQIPITLQASSKELFNERARVLSNSIVFPNMEKETSIVFGEEPDIVYYGHFEGISDPTPLNETAWDHSMTLTFVASDPRGFFNKDNEVVDLSSGNVSFTPKGTAFADPIITIEPKSGAKPLTQFGYTINGDEKVIVGRSTDTLKKFDTKPAVFIDPMESMGNWQRIIPPLSNPNSALSFDLAREDVLTDGTIQVDPSSTSAITNSVDGSKNASWSSTPEKLSENPWYYGPVAVSKTNLASSIGDGNNWESSFKIHNIKRYSRASQGLEMYLLDKDGKRRARFGIRNDGSGSRSYSWIRFGKNYDDETKSVMSGLGYGQNYGLDSDYKDKQDVSVSVPNGKTVDVFKPYATKTIKKEYSYTSLTSTTKITETWSSTETTTFDPKTNKYTKKIVYSPLNSTYDKNYDGETQYTNYIIPSAHNDFRYISDWGDWLKLEAGKIQYWTKGWQKRQHDFGRAPLVPNEYYENSTTPGKVPLHNYSDITVTNTYYSPEGKSTNEIIKMHYVNGNGERINKDGKNFINNFGLLDSINYVYETVSSDATEKTTQKEMADYPDKREAGTYDDTFLNVVIGKDNNGFYWQVDELQTDASAKGVSVIPKTYDKRPDLHTDYLFTIDKMAIHFFKSNIAEDKNVYVEGDETQQTEGDSKYVPALKYDDNYMSLFDARVYKLLKAPNYIDLINLKPGQKAQFDTTTNIFTIDGRKRQDLVNYDSTWPQIRGGVVNNIKITPNPGNDYAIKMIYRPTIL